MKVGSVEITRCEQVLVLPRLDSEDIVFRAVAVSSMDEFEAICPEPKAPGIRTKDGFKPDTKDEGYQQLVSLHGDKRLAFIVIKSLEPSNIEWDEVTIEDPTTWTKWQEELLSAGLSNIEANRVVSCVMEANALDEDKLKEARDSFLLGLAQE
jgi:hypothetical protein